MRPATLSRHTRFRDRRTHSKTCCVSIGNVVFFFWYRFHVIFIRRFRYLRPWPNSRGTSLGFFAYSSRAPLPFFKFVFFRFPFHFTLSACRRLPIRLVVSRRRRECVIVAQTSIKTGSIYRHKRTFNTVNVRVDICNLYTVVQLTVHH